MRMAQLVLNHRRKLKAEGYEQAKMIGGDSLVYLCLLLRLAVLAHHSRSDHDNKNLMKLTIKDNNHWQIEVNVDSEDYPLLSSDLYDDVEQFEKWGVELNVL